MTEMEKMTAGQIYDSSDSKLLELRGKAHRLCTDYNQTYETETEKRNEIMKQLLPNRGENLYLQGPVQFDYGCFTTFGKNCYANFNLTILDCAPVTIGDDVFFGPNCSVVTPVHPLVAEERKEKVKPDGTLYTMEYARPVTIGNGVWCATGVTICGGVKIGNNCVIGAGSVVTHDIPDNSFAAGVPCKVIRKITDADRILK